MQIAFVTYPGITALDVVGPYEVLRFLPDAEIRTVWHVPGPVVTDSGVLVLGATHSFTDTPSPDIVVVPGSTTSVAVAAADPLLLAWLRRAHHTTEWTVSVCGGSVILAAAGLLDGVPATSHWQALPVLRAFGAIPRPDDRIVHHGRIVTGAGVSAGIDLALWLAGTITGDARAQAIQLMLEYDPRPPYSSGHVGKASRATKVLAGTLLTLQAANTAQLPAATRLLWSAALDRVRSRSRRRFPR